jgi:Cu(I)/Ag(I) efflux system membrane protein CusA/SilA
MAQQMTLPPGIAVAWSGHFGYLANAMERLKLVVPIALVIIFGLIYAVLCIKRNLNANAVRI